MIAPIIGQPVSRQMSLSDPRECMRGVFSRVPLNRPPLLGDYFITATCSLANTRNFRCVPSHKYCITRAFGQPFRRCKNHGLGIPSNRTKDKVFSRAGVPRQSHMRLATASISSISQGTKLVRKSLYTDTESTRRCSRSQLKNSRARPRTPPGLGSTSRAQKQTQPTALHEPPAAKHLHRQESVKSYVCSWPAPSTRPLRVSRVALGAL